MYYLLQMVVLLGGVSFFQFEPLISLLVWTLYEERLNLVSYFRFYFFAVTLTQVFELLLDWATCPVLSISWLSSCSLSGFDLAFLLGAALVECSPEFKI